MLMENFEGGMATLGVKSVEVEAVLSAAALEESRIMLKDLRAKLASGRFVGQEQRELIESRISELERIVS